MLMSHLPLRHLGSAFQKKKIKRMSTDCSCQIEGKLWLIEGATSTEQKNSSSVLRLTPLTWSLEIKGEKYQEKMDDRVVQGGRALYKLV